MRLANAAGYAKQYPSPGASVEPIFITGDRVEILDEGMLQNTPWRFGRVVEKKRPSLLGPTDIVITLEGDDSGDRCLLPASRLRKA